MTQANRDDDMLLEEALAAFRQAAGPGAPPGVLVSLLERQAAAGPGRRGASAWTVLAFAVSALVAGFWVGRISGETPGSAPDVRPAAVAESPPAADSSGAPERRAAPGVLPKPPRIPFVSA